MTRCFDLSERLARDLLSFHQDLASCRATRAPFWRGLGALALLGRAARLEHALRRDPPHEVALALDLLLPLLRRREASEPRLRALLPVLHERPWLIDLWQQRFRLQMDTAHLDEETFDPGDDPFLRDLDGAAGALAPDLRSLCALLAQGQLEAAEALLPRIERGRPEALGRLAAARVARGAAAAQVWSLHGVREKSARRQARLAVLRALLAGGRVAEALATIETLDGGADRARAAALAAEALHEQGFGDQAARLLARHDGGGEAGELLEIRWQIEAGVALREAGARLVELTRRLGALRRDDRDGALWHPVFPGVEPVTPRVEAALLGVALRLRGDASLTTGAAMYGSSELVRQRIASCGASRVWLARRLRAAEQAGERRADRASPQGDRARALLLHAPGQAGEAAGDLEAARALVEGALGGRWDEARRSGRLGDARSERRAAFDEGTSLGPERARRRRALAQVARRVLIDSQRGVGDASVFTVEARVRCLLQLDGVDAASIFTGALEATEGTPRGTQAIFAGLCRASPPRARAVFYTRFGALLRAAGAGLLDEASRALPAAQVLALRGLLAELERGRTRAEAGAWMGELLAGWWRQRGEPPSPDLLALLVHELRHGGEGELPEPGSLLDDLRGLAAQITTQPAEAIVEALARDESAPVALAMLSLAGHAEPEPRWPLASWQAAARRLRGEIGAAASGLTQRWCSRLAPSRAGLPSRLLRGEAPVDLPREIELVGRYQLCWLDKTRDFLAFVRFADSVNCCFHSASHSYRSSMDTQRAVLSLWRDPFSFAMRIQRRSEAGESRAEGFVFGSLGHDDEGLVLLLNGLYLRRQIATLRASILEAIEQQVARPLGARRIGLGARHGGRGELPGGYECGQAVQVRRLRALVLPSGALASQTYDDLSLPPNQRVWAPLSLFWKRL